MDSFTSLEPFSNLPKPKAGILDIHAYVGGKSKIDGVADPIKLSSNENALGCSSLALKAFEGAALKLYRYPDGLANPLREAVANYHDLEPSRLVFGNGSDEVFSMLNLAYLEPGDNIVTGEHGFLAYRISAQACQAEVRLAPEPEQRVMIENLLALVNERTKIVYISNPANPTGTWNTPEDIAELRARLNPSVILVIDEAYAEFAGQTTWAPSFEMARGLENMVVTRTFSKIHGLAGLRVGFGYASEAIVTAIERIRSPFNINLPAQYAAIAALNDQAFIDASAEHVLRWRPRFYQTIRGLGLRVEASAGNFVLIYFKDESEAVKVNAHLLASGFIVRHVANYGLPQALRITIGPDKDNEGVLAALSAYKP
jgi:histidinol-phosphate aminotransferase